MAAQAFLASLRPEHLSTAAFGFDDDERRRWFYTPTDHGGLALSLLTPPQQRLGLQLLASALSGPGYATAVAIMGLENVLDRNEGWRNRAMGTRGRDPMRYYVSVFGTPGDRAWAWRVGGHHLSMSVTVVDGTVSSSTPLFFGADPAETVLMGGQLHRPLGSVEDVARALLRSLDDEQRAIAVLSDSAPSDIVMSNRSAVVDGAVPRVLADIFRDPFTGADLARMQAGQAQLDATLGATESSRAAVAYSTAPKGLAGSHMSTASRLLLVELVEQYVGRLPPELSAAWHARTGATDGGSLSFAWAGSASPRHPHYYRVQGPRLLLEYDNTQNDVNHVHSVLRDPLDDFGADMLEQHYRAEH